MTPLSPETIRAMLAHLSPDAPRDEWAAVAMALKSELGEAGFDTFDTWSQRGEKYRAADVRSTWRSIKAGGGVTAGTLVHMAKAAGWRPDPSNTNAQGPSPATLAAEAEAREARRAAADAERERQEAQHRERAAHARELWDQAAEGGEAAYPARKGLKGLHGARVAPGGVLRVPMRDAAGELWNVQDILPERMRDRVTGEPTTDKLYAAGKGARKAGLWHLIGEAAGADVLLIGEGFATCASVHEATGRPAAVAFDAGNLAAVARELRRLYPAALLVLVADNDHGTEAATGRNPGREAAEKVARAVRGVSVWPELAELPEGGSDWNDAARHAGADLVRDRIEAAIRAAMAATQATLKPKAPARAPAGRTSPARPAGQAGAAPNAQRPPAGRATRTDTDRPGAPADVGGEPPEGDYDGDDGDGDGEHDPFSVDRRGVWFHGFDHQGRPRPALLVCGPLLVTARTRLANGAGWGWLVEFTDPERTPKEWTISTAALQGDGVEYRRTLADLGLYIGETRAAREKLGHYIQSRRVRAFARVVERAGWHGRLYVLPGRTFGATDERVILSPEGTSEHPFRQRGTLEKWRGGVARACDGNTRPTFAVSAAFAGPLLRLAGMQSGGFHFVGPSSRGKTSALYAAASVWGSPEMKRLWRATDNAVEYLAQLHSDSVLILDELKQADPKVIAEAIYMLGNGTGRNRATQRGGLRPTPSWSVLFLSSGELTPEAHMATVRLQPMEGQRVRMPSIPAEPEGYPGTTFETNHELEGGRELSQYMVHQAAVNYGHAGLAFLERTTADFDAVRARLRAGLESFRLAHVPETADGQLSRIADRFALVAMAGELATEWGLTGWATGWATEAAAACFYGMVKMRPGGFGSGEEAAMLRQARTYFAEHGEDRFADWGRAESDDTHRPNTQQRAGWRKTTRDSIGEADSTEWFVLFDGFTKQVAEGHDREAMLRLLRERGHLVPDKGRPFDHSARLPGIGKTRCYRIKSSILADIGED
jgi:putative DNA primase/helicase